MGQNDADRHGSRPASWQRAIFVAYAAGILVLQTPFQLRYKLGNGGFGYNFLIGLGLVIGGVFLIAGLARLFRVLSRSDANLYRSLCHRTQLLLALATASFITALVLKLETLALWYVGLGFVGLWIANACLSIMRAETCPRRKLPLTTRLRNRARAIARQPWPFNGVFWGLIFLTLVAKDLFTISEINGAHTIEIIFLILGRTVTNAAFTLAMIFIVQALLALAPRCLRWAVIASASIIPLVIISAFFVRQAWNKSLIEVFNDFTASGRFDISQELEASGLSISPFGVLLLAIAVAATCFSAFMLLQKISSNFSSCRTRTIPAAFAFAVIWFFSIAEQGLSMATKRTEIWQEEHKLFGVQLGLFTPPPGLETIQVEVLEPQPESLTEELLASAASLPELERKPDIYILMVESWRADSISAEVTPFLYRFSNTDCQPFEQTYSGSNCTPLSWFTMFHSRLALHWADSVKGAENPDGLPGAYPVRLLKELGYETSVRAVCDLGYKKLGELNFGTDHSLADTFRDDNTLPGDLAFPEREMIIVENLKEQVLDSEPGGHLHFIAFDSPHYNYYWPEKDFTPLNHGCEGTINYTNISPTAAEILEVQKRYHNSVNWMDHQIENFITFLKEEGRYDDATIIITGDHGEEFQEHGSWFHCSTLKKEQTDVPIMMKWPSWMETPIPQQQVSHLDIMPSILDMLGLEDKYLSHLSGNSVLREHPNETVISTIHRGMSNVGICIIKDGIKANFTFRGLWEGGLPDEISLADYTDLNDQPVSVLAELGTRTHTEFLRDRFPVSTSRFFKAFGEPLAITPEEPEPELAEK